MIKKKKKSGSIIAPLIITILPIVLLAQFASGIVLDKVMERNIYDMKTVLGHTVTSDITKAFGDWIEDQKIFCEILAMNQTVIDACLDPEDPGKYAAGRKLFDETLKKYPFYENIVVMLYHGQADPLTVNTGGKEIEIPDGSILFSPAGDHVVGKAATRNFSTEVKKSKDYFMSEAYLSLANQVPIFVLSVPLMHEGRLIGAVGVAPKMTHFVDKFAHQEYFGEGEYIFIVNNEGNVIAHPNQEFILTEEGKEAFAGFMPRLNAGEYTFEAEFGGTQNLYVTSKLTAFEGHQADEWFFVYRDVLDDMYADLRYIALITAVMAIVSVALIILIILITSRRVIVKPLKVIGRELDEIAKGGGDLTNELDIRSANEIGSIAGSFNGFTDTLRQMITRIKGAVETNSSLRNNLASSTEETSASIHEILSNIDSIKSVMDKLKDQTDKAGGSTSEISATIGDLTRQAADQSSAVEESTAAVEEMVSSLKSMSQVTSRNRDISDRLQKSAEAGSSLLDDTYRSIQQVNTNVDSILEMTSVIDNISSQTNLLAMNAAIEAAHAGESGKGFAVVADEIRKLAENSSASSAKIGNEIRTIIEQIQHSGEYSRQLQEIIGTMVSEIEGLTSAFTEINASSQEMSSGSDQILKAMSSLSEAAINLNEAAGNMKTGTDNTSGNINAVEELSRTAVAAIEEISFGSNEIMKAMSEMQERVQDLGESAEGLAHEVDRFKTE